MGASVTDAEFLRDIAARIARVSKERITGEFDLPDADALRAIAARLEKHATLKRGQREDEKRQVAERKAAEDREHNIGARLMGSDCCEGRHDECGHKGTTEPMKVCGCPCHGQYGKMCRLCWRERTGEGRGQRLPKLVLKTKAGTCVFCAGRKAREKLQEPRSNGRLACQAARDGECYWKNCPQMNPLRRLNHCALDLLHDDDDEFPPDYERAVADPDDETRAAIAEMPCEHLPLSSHALRVMRGLGATTLRELSQRSATTVALQHGAGKKVMRELDVALATVGLTFDQGRWIDNIERGVII